MLQNLFFCFAEKGHCFFFEKTFEGSLLSFLRCRKDAPFSFQKTSVSFQEKAESLTYSIKSLFTMDSKIGGSTYCRNDLKLELENLRRVGYDFAEIDLSHPVAPDKNFEALLDNAENILPILSGHLPEIDFRKDDLEKCKRFMEILSQRNVKLFVIHLSGLGLPTKEDFPMKLNALKELADFAETKDCVLVLENTMEDSEMLKKVFDEIPNLSFCFDIGHANLFSVKNCSLDFIDNFKNILRHVHVHDNHGIYEGNIDSHLPIGAGSINFMPIFRKLKEINYPGKFTLEIFNPDVECRKISMDWIRKLV